MYRRGNKTKIITSLVLVLVLGLSLGFAAFTNTLRITPQATITPDSATFDIDFSSSSSSVVANDITPTLTGTGLTAEAASIDNSTNPTISNLQVNFTKPGQKAEYKFYAYNNGAYLAYLSSVNFLNPEGKDKYITCEATDSKTQYVDEACNGIKVSIKVGSLTTDVTKENISGHSLDKQTAEEVIVTIEYETGSAVADGEFTADIGDITLVYTSVDNESGGNVVLGKTCTFDGDLVQGAEFVDGQYTYKYMQEAANSESDEWNDISEEGWGVRLTDRYSSDPVTTTLCSTINEKPIVSMQAMFLGASPTTLDLSSFDTSNVTNMEGMFVGSPATTLDLSSFDTSNVTSMHQMFAFTGATILGLSNFDTSNVTSMSYMFQEFRATTLDLSSFDTSKVTSMEGMFGYANIEILDLSSFDMSNVNNYYEMFMETQATTAYARTQADADKFNNADITGISGFTFQVK